MDNKNEMAEVWPGLGGTMAQNIEKTSTEVTENEVSKSGLPNEKSIVEPDALVYIKGVDGRGAEVIDALERRGAANAFKYTGNFENRYYYIGLDGLINMAIRVSSLIKKYYMEIELSETEDQIFQRKVKDLFLKNGIECRFLKVEGDEMEICPTFYYDLDRAEGEAPDTVLIRYDRELQNLYLKFSKAYGEISSRNNFVWKMYGFMHSLYSKQTLLGELTDLYMERVKSEIIK